MAELSSLADIERAFLNADRAGDTESAAILATEIQRRRSTVQPTEKVEMTPELMQEKGAEMAAADAGPFGAAMVGAGRSVSKVVAGVKQPFTGDPEGLKRQQAEEDAFYRAMRVAHPVATAGGEALPYVAVPASMGVVPAAATVGTIEALKYGTPAERAARGASGAVATGAGGLLAKGAAGLIAPVTKKAAGPATQDALQAAKRVGVKPRLSQVTGRQGIERLEDYAARVPGGAGVMQDFAAANQSAVNRSAARAIGENADELSAGVFQQAADRLGQVFEGIKSLGGRPIQIGPNVAAAADDILRQQSKMLPQQQDQALVQLANQAKMLAANRGRIDGETYQLVRSGLSEAAFEASGTNRVLYGNLLNALDDSADASLRATGQTALADALQTARPQYANLKMLEKGAVAEAGNVSPPRLASVMRAQNPSAFRRGHMGDLGDIARMGEGMKPLRAGSPTMEREAVSNPISMIANALWSYPIAKATTLPLVTAYPRTFGRTAAARGLAELTEPTGRAAIAAALQRSGMLPFIPEMAE